MGEVRHFKFGGLAYHSMSQPVGHKPSLKGAWSQSRDQLQNFTPHEISSERLKIHTSNFVHGLAMRSTNLHMTNCPLSGSGQGHATHSTLCLKKVPTIKLSVTLSNLNRFSKFFHCWKAYEICYKSHTTLPTLP